MPRPFKKRCVCSEPEHKCFGPKNSNNTEELILSVDEYETIRLIDLENKTQEEASIQMEVARTTVQSIYTSARNKIADAMVNGKNLIIMGGDYVICPKNKSGCAKGCGKGFCHKYSKEIEES